MPPDVSVIIPTLNNVRFTAECFASLAQTTGITYEIIVVDNGSDDETISFASSHTPGQLRGKAQGSNPPVNVRILHNTERYCLSRSWNMGMDASVGKYPVLSNNDVIYAPGSLLAMVQAIEHPQVGVCLPWSPQNASGILPQVKPPRIIADTIQNLMAVSEWDARREKTGKVHYIRDGKIRQGGYCFMVKRGCWERVGRFDEDYKLTAEDYDWFIRTQRYYKISQAEDAYVEHHGSQTRQWLFDDNYLRTIRNRFLLSEKQEGLREMFSVVMPVYNRINSLRAAIESVRLQSYPHWKLYIIDDGSEDWDQIQSLAEDYSGKVVDETGRICFFHLRENRGPGNARNVGMEMSKGKYVAFLDSDDIWYPNHLQVHLDTHETGDWQMVYTDPEFAWRWWDIGTRTFLHKRESHPTIRYWGAFDRGRLSEYNYIQTSSVSIWGDTARGLKFNDRRIEEDWDFFRSLPDPVRHVPFFTCRYHLSKNAESEHLVGRVLDISGSAPSWETRNAIIISHSLKEPAALGVVIPTSNRPEKLDRALESMGYLDIPFCVCDDGSREATKVAEVVQKYLQGSLLRLEGVHGPSIARNRACEYLPVEWIQLLDDDDILCPGWYDTMMRVIGADWDVITFAAYVPGSNGFSASDDLFTSQMCVRREMFLRVGGFIESLHWGEERNLMERLERMGAKVKRLKMPLVLRPERGGTGRPETFAEGEIEKPLPTRRRRGMF